MSPIRVVKRKVTGFFHTKDIPIIRDVVKDVHKIMTNASILVRSYCLKTFEVSKTVPKVDKDLLNIACRIVQGNETSGFRSTKNKDLVKLKTLKC